MFPKKKMGSTVQCCNNSSFLLLVSWTFRRCGSGGEWSETKEWSSYKEMQVYIVLHILFNKTR
nr:hypothetical protein Iba_chr05eCG9970 [Ipomoea batatas]